MLPRLQRGTSRRAVLGWGLAFALLGAALWTWQWSIDRSRANQDAYYYARQALVYAGWSQTAADNMAADWTYRVIRPGIGGTYTPERLTVSSDPRYAGFFRARILYPMVAAVFVPAFGVDAMAFAAMLAGVLLAVVIGLSMLRLTASPAASLIAVALCFALPSGRYLMWVMAEGWAIALLACCIAAASLHVHEGGRRWLVALTVSLVLLGATKIGVAELVALAAVGAALLALSPRFSRLPRGRAFAVGTIAGSIVGAFILLFAVLGLPSITDQIQDTLTHHFSTPDVADPWRALARRLPRFARSRLNELPTVPLNIVAALVGIAGLLARRSWAWYWFLASGATLLLVLVHPVRSDIDRVMAPLWLGVSIGIALLVTELLSWLSRRGTRRAERGAAQAG